MDDVLFARAQMAMSLGFHIVFAVIGMSMPLLLVVAEAMWLRTRDPDYLRLARAWAKGVAVLFAVGAVSGTVLSFELGLLFPTFMRHAGPLVGMPFSLEGFAFFTEAIFLGIYLYGWRRVPERLHLLAGVGVAVSGVASAVFVTLVNAWMNAPRGFRVDGAGNFVDIDPLAAMTTPFALHEVVHMVVAAYMSTGFGVAAVHALALLRRRKRGLDAGGVVPGFHAKAMKIALAVAIPFTLAQPLVGDYAGQQVAEHQPEKLAAIEGHYVTRAEAPLHLGGIPDDERREVRWGIEIPWGLSLLAHHDPRAVVRGLEEFPREEWPPTVIHHFFQIMVGIGTALAALALWAAWAWWRRKEPPLGSRAFLIACAAAGPASFVAIEAGWVVTEVGRQPWTIWHVLRTSDAVTPMPGLAVPFALFTLVYLGLAAAVIAILRRQVRAADSPAPATGSSAHRGGA